MHFKLIIKIKQIQKTFLSSRHTHIHAQTLNYRLKIAHIF